MNELTEGIGALDNIFPKERVHVRHKVEDNVYTQTSYTGQIRWCRKPLYDEPILQQQVVINTIKNFVVTKQKVEWVDVPIEWIKD